MEDDRPEPLRELRRDLAEVHAVATRTSNTVSTLAASLKEVVTRQDRYERGLNLNSLIAYILFTVLLGGGFYFLYRSRVGQILADWSAATRKYDDAVAQASAARKEVQVRDDAARKAQEFWQLLRDGKKAEAIARYPEIKDERLTPTEAQAFQDGVARAKAELIEASFNDGVEAIKAEQWKRAATELKRALSYEEEGPRTGQMRYFYGVALSKLGDYQEAAHQLELAIAGNAERSVGQDARYYLAGAFEMLRQLDRAKTDYLKFADAHPAHALAGLARRKAADIAARTAPPAPKTP